MADAVEWITENGWTRREVNGRASYVRCDACDAPVAEVTSDHAWCRWCAEIAASDPSPNAATTSGCSITSPHVHVGPDPHGPSDDAARPSVDDEDGEPCPECGHPFGTPPDPLAPTCRYCQVPSPSAAERTSSDGT